MKFFYFFVLIAIYYRVQCDQLVGEDNFDKIFRSKCETNSNDKKVFLDLIKIAHDLPDCFKNALGEKVPTPLEDFEGYCKRMNSNIYYNCINGFTKAFAPCLGKEELYLPNMILDTYNASLKDFCENDGVTKVTELLSTIDNDPCLNRGLRTILLICVKDLKLVKNFQKNNYVIKKNDICGDFETISTCTNEAILEHCKTDYSRYVNLFFNPYLEWCKLNQ